MRIYLDWSGSMCLWDYCYCQLHLFSSLQSMGRKFWSTSQEWGKQVVYQHAGINFLFHALVIECDVMCSVVLNSNFNLHGKDGFGPGTMRQSPFPLNCFYWVVSLEQHNRIQDKHLYQYWPHCCHITIQMIIASPELF